MKNVRPAECETILCEDAMVGDRFGIPWMINCDGADQPPEGGRSPV